MRKGEGVDKGQRGGKDRHEARVNVGRCDKKWGIMMVGMRMRVGVFLSVEMRVRQ